MIEPLRLNYRDVAKLNIVNVDRLGAFNSCKRCFYHYRNSKGKYDGIHCAIGIADPAHKIKSEDFVRALNISSDNLSRLAFIQFFHDQTLVMKRDNIRDMLWSQFLKILPADIPASVKNLMAELGDVAITKEVYVRVMQVIADE